MKVIFLISLLTLSACASQTKLAKLGPNDWTELTCSGFKNWHDCRTEARGICPNGFYTADSLENLLIQRRVVEVACKS